MDTNTRKALCAIAEGRSLNKHPARPRPRATAPSSGWLSDAYTTSSNNINATGSATITISTNFQAASSGWAQYTLSQSDG